MSDVALGLAKETFELAAGKGGSGARVALSNVDRRLDYVLARLRFCLDSGACTPTRAYSRAGMTIGSMSARSLVDLRRAIREDDREWIKTRMPVEPPKKAVGVVYFINSSISSDRIKIGFTTNMASRWSGLNSEYGPVTLLASIGATILDELVFHCANYQQRRVGEWFDHPSIVAPGTYETLAEWREMSARFGGRRAA